MKTKQIMLFIVLTICAVIERTLPYVHSSDGALRITNERILYVTFYFGARPFIVVLTDHPYSTDMKIKRNRFLYSARLVDDRHSYGYMVVGTHLYGMVVSNEVKYEIVYEDRRYKVEEKKMLYSRNDNNREYDSKEYDDREYGNRVYDSREYDDREYDNRVYDNIEYNNGKEYNSRREYNSREYDNAMKYDNTGNIKDTMNIEDGKECNGMNTLEDENSIKNDNATRITEERRKTSKEKTKEAPTHNYHAQTINKDTLTFNHHLRNNVKYFKIVFVNDYERTNTIQNIGMVARRTFLDTKEYFERLGLGIELVLIDVLNIMEPVDFVDRGRCALLSGDGMVDKGLENENNDELRMEEGEELEMKEERTIKNENNDELRIEKDEELEMREERTTKDEKKRTLKINNHQNDRLKKMNRKKNGTKEGKQRSHCTICSTTSQNEHINASEPYECMSSDVHAYSFLSNFANKFDSLKNDVRNEKLNNVNLFVLFSSDSISTTVDALTFRSGACSLANNYSVIFNTAFARMNTPKVLSHEILHSLSADHGDKLMAEETDGRWEGVSNKTKTEILQFVNKHGKCFDDGQRCGNGIVDEGEECDDGLMYGSERCTRECRIRR